nr:cation-translocating P-type ATPase [Candidatus Freyarchaeota archaeon]
MHEPHENEAACSVCEVKYEEATPLRRDKRILIIASSGALLSTGLLFELILKWETLALLLFIATAVISGYSIAKEAFTALILERKFSINLLIVIAAVGSFFIGHGEEGVAVVFLFYIAEFLEEYAGRRARKSIESLMRLAPEVATVKRDGEEVGVPVGEIDINQILVVRPGEKIPLDGVVVNGISSVNQAPITGESVPVTKQVGDEVYAGTINNEGFMEIRVTKRVEETILSKIVKLVEEAQKIKSPTEKFIDRFARYYTPAVVLIALGVAVIPTFVFNLPFDEWIYKALVLLVVSCPCALAISTPVSMVSGITSAARNGVLIKGSTFVEEISKVRVFAFDKTGTLTEGKLEVTDTIPLEQSEEHVLLKAASLEALSEHPIARAIVERAKNDRNGVELESVEEFRAIAGKGISGKINGEVYYVGSRRLFKEMSADFPEEFIRDLENQGKTVILVGNTDRVLGIIGVMDRIREEAFDTIAELKRRGIKTVMITGDNERTARAIAERIGLDEYHAELLPQDKVNIIEKLSEEFERVAMVGDGVNDAPALARANVGIAMGSIGSDVSLENADIALMQDDLSKLVYLIDMSKKTLEIVRENVISSLLVKGSFAVLAFPGLITLWLAVAIGDMGLSLAVILNSLRLGLLKPKKSESEKQATEETKPESEKRVEPLEAV